MYIQNVRFVASLVNIHNWLNVASIVIYNKGSLTTINLPNALDSDQIDTPCVWKLIDRKLPIILLGQF